MLFNTMMAAVSKAAKVRVGLTKYFRYEVSNVQPSGEGWFEMRDKFQLAEFFDEFRLWGGLTYHKYSENIQAANIALRQPFYVRFI